MPNAPTTHLRSPRALVLPLACLLAAASCAMAHDSTTPPIKIGGAIGVSWAYGSYGTDDNPHRRGDKVGDADLDIFRLNADLSFHSVIGRVEYRWFDPYSMIHTAWLGYDAGDAGTVKAGIVRVPFGPTAYGVSSSFFFDQHWYVGLSDDMDLGLRWTGAAGALALDVGYYYSCIYVIMNISRISKWRSHDVKPTRQPARTCFRNRAGYGHRPWLANLSP